MESLYYVMSWLCHRTCEHCYEDRFRPYYGADLAGVVAESVANMPRIIDHLPARMTYLDRRDPDGAGGYREKPGSVILAGGEILLDPVREAVLYAGIERLQGRYRRRGGVKIIVQTTGDLLTRRIAEELKELGVWMVSVSGLDKYHAGLETAAARESLREKCGGILEQAGFELLNKLAEQGREAADEGHYYHFFGATADLWIGKLWPRGRAWRHGLSTAGIEDNFCHQWSGGLNFLETRYSGSEVSIDPRGDVFPCCVKTKRPVGNVVERPLEEILDALRGNAVYEAINAGRPERMGLTHGWSEEKFREKSRVPLATGGIYENLCIGCDAFHDEVLGAAELVQISGAGSGDRN